MDRMDESMKSEKKDAQMRPLAQPSGQRESKQEVLERRLRDLELSVADEEPIITREEWLKYKAENPERFSP